MPQPAAARETASVHHLPNALPEHPDNPGMPFDPEPVAAVRVNLSAVERRAATLPDAAHGEEGMAGGVAGPRHRVHRPHHALRRRHRGPRRAALRQGAEAAPRRPPGGARPRRSPHHRRRGLRLSPLRRDGEAGARRLGHSGRRRLDRLPGRPRPVRDAASRDRGLGRRRRRRDRHGDHPRACAQGRLAGALRRGPRLQGRPAARPT